MSCRAMVTVGVVVGAGVVVTSLGTLVADVSTKDRATHEVSTFKDLTIATLDLPAGELKAKDGVVALNAVPATLTADGTKAFGGMYEQGETLDALSAAVSLTEDGQLPGGSGGTGSTGGSGGTTGGSGTTGGTAGTAGGGSVGGSAGGTGNLASTGAEVPAGALMGAAGALAVAGGAAVSVARRRNPATGEI
ncbi:HtaA domain-containing protein [Streptomyces niveus]|uniref:HtaA domain-containing protein n=1 Tax=Streptomyces niveus TaxID=193462 RepID=UPI0036D22E1F